MERGRKCGMWPKPVFRGGPWQSVTSCHHLKANHCISCHEDADFGYCDMCWLVNRNLKWEAEVCCSVSLAIEGAERFARATFGALGTK